MPRWMQPWPLRSRYTGQDWRLRTPTTSSPNGFDRLLDRCLSKAYEGAREAAEEAERRAYDATFNEIYATTLSDLLAKALAEYDENDTAG